MTRTTPRILRALLGVVGLAAIITDVIYGLTTIEGFSLLNYFSFFTVLSTLMTSLLLLYIAITDKHLPLARGAVTLFMLITGIVYFILLRNEPIQIFWINTVYHYVLPAALLADWLINPPSRRVSVRSSLLWLLFPAAFLVYSLVRGAFTDWYPYPFMNVTEIGYAQTFMNVVVVGLGMALLAVVVASVTRLTVRNE